MKNKLTTVALAAASFALLASCVGARRPSRILIRRCATQPSTTPGFVDENSSDQWFNADLPGNYRKLGVKLEVIPTNPALCPFINI